MGLGGTFEESVTFQINPRITFTDMCSNFPALTKESLDYWVNSDPSISSVWDISNILLFSGNWTEIGNYVFNGFSKPAGYSLGVGYDRTTRDLGEILPESLKHIGIYAFNDVLDIDTLTFDNTPNLETIGKGAFANNGISGPLDLSPLTKLERIGYNSDALTMMVAADLRNLDSQTIRTRDTCGTSFTASAITSEVFGTLADPVATTDFEAVVSMGQVNTGAFQNNSFTSLNLSDLSNLKLLGTSTFERNDMSGTLDLTSLTNLETISPCVFIHNKFNGTLDLSQLKKIKHIYEYAFAENLFDGSLIFGTSPSLESIGQAAFTKNKFTGELDLSPLKNLRSIGSDYNSKSDTTMPFNFNSDIFVAGANIARPSWEKVPPGVFQDNSFTSVNFGDLSQVTTIGNSAFENNNFSNGIDLSPLKKLKTIAPCGFENSVTDGPLIFGSSPSLEYIDSEAFVDNSFTGGLDLSGLTNLKKIGYDAFKSGNFSGSLDFSGLTNLKTIENGVFENNDFSGPLDLSPLKKLEYLGSRILFEYEGQIRFDYPSAFLPDLYLSMLNIVDLDTNQYSSIFGKNNFTTLNFGNLSSLKVIGRHVFNSWVSDQKLFGTLDLSGLSNLECILEGAFYDNSFSGTLKLGNSPLVSIGQAAFASNNFTGELDLSPLKNLKYIGFDYSVNSLVDHYGKKRTEFSDVLFFPEVLPADLAEELEESPYLYDFEKKNPPGVFQDNDLSSVKFTDLSQVTTIGNSAFENNIFLNEIDLSPLKKLNKISSRAFYNLFDPDVRIDKGTLILGNSPSLEYIDSEAFAGNSFTDGLDMSGLTNLKKIGFDAFRNCNFSGTLDFSGLTNLEIIENGVFSYNDFSGPLDLSPLKNLKYLGSPIIFYSEEEGEMYGYPGDENSLSIKFEYDDRFRGPTIIFENNNFDIDLFKDKLPIFGNNQFTTLEFGDLSSLKFIGDNTFTPYDPVNRKFLRKLTGNLDLRKLSNLEYIGNGAFSDNFFSGTLMFGDISNLRNIGNGAFSNNDFSGNLDLSGLTNLRNIGMGAFSNNNFSGNLDFSGLNNLEFIGDVAFQSNKFSGQLDLSPLINLKYLGFSEYFPPYTMESNYINDNFDWDIFYKSLEAKYDGDVDDDYLFAEARNVKAGVETSNKDIILTKSSSIFGNNNFTSLKFGDLSSLKSIGDSAFEKSNFSGNLDLTSFTSLESLGNRAFFDTSFSGTLTFGDISNLRVIGSKAFYKNKFSGNLDLSGLTKLIYIDTEAFANNSFDEALTFPDSSLLHIGQGAFAKNIFTGELDLSPLKNLRSIGRDYNSGFRLSGLQRWAQVTPGVFQDNSFTSVNFADLSQVTTIGNSAFENNKFSNGIDLSPLKKLKIIAPCAFENSVTDGPLIFGSSPSLEYIDSEAFVDNSFTGGLDLSGLTNLKRIGYDAFKSGNFSGSLNFKDLSSLELIGPQAFANNSFTSISFYNVPNLTEIPSEAFKNNDLSGIIDLSPLTNLRKIGANAFDSSFENITKIIIPAHPDTSFEIEPQNLLGSGFSSLRSKTILPTDTMLRNLNA